MRPRKAVLVEVLIGSTRRGVAVREKRCPLFECFAPGRSLDSASGKLTFACDTREQKGCPAAAAVTEPPAYVRRGRVWEAA